MQESERRAARHRPLPDVGNRKRGEHALETIGFEPVIEPVRRRHRQRAHQLDHAGLAEPAEFESETRERQILAETARIDPRRRPAIELARKPGDLR